MPCKLGPADGEAEVTDDQIRARRRARGIVTDLRWLGIAIPPLYCRMADEFTALVRNGEYARWLAGHPSSRDT